MLNLGFSDPSSLKQKPPLRGISFDLLILQDHHLRCRLVRVIIFDVICTRCIVRSKLGWERVGALLEHALVSEPSLPHAACLYKWQPTIVAQAGQLVVRKAVLLHPAACHARDLLQCPSWYHGIPKDMHAACDWLYRALRQHTRSQSCTLTYRFCDGENKTSSF